MNQYTLELFTEQDIPVLLEWLEGTDLRFLRQYSGPRYTWPLTSGQLEEELKNRSGGTQDFFRYADAGTGRAAGFCQLMDLGTEEGTAKIGRVLVSRELRDRGIGGRMLRALMQYGRENLGIRRYVLSVYDFNRAALQCYRHLGFHFLKSAEVPMVELGENWTGIVMCREVPDVSCQEDLGRELVMTVESFRREMGDLEEPLVSKKLSKEHWSLKELIGHLIDSASNNHQRFVRLLREPALEFPSYHWTWMETQKYNEADYGELMQLWELFNRHLARLICLMPDSALEHTWATEGETWSLRGLTEDYVGHLKHHLTAFRSRLEEIETAPGREQPQ